MRECPVGTKFTKPWDHLLAEPCIAVTPNPRGLERGEGRRPSRNVHYRFSHICGRFVCLVEIFSETKRERERGTKLKLETRLFLKDSNTHETLSAAASLLFLHILLPWKWPSLISVVTGLHGPGHHFWPYETELYILHHSF